MPPSGWWLEPEMLRWLHIRPHTSSLNRGQVNKTWTVCPESWLNKWRVNKRTQRCILFGSSSLCISSLENSRSSSDPLKESMKGKNTQFFFLLDEDWSRENQTKAPIRCPDHGCCRSSCKYICMVAALVVRLPWRPCEPLCFPFFLLLFLFFFLSCLVWFKSEISATKPQRHVLRVATRWMSVPGSNPSQILLAFLCGGGVFFSNLCGQKYNRSLVYVLFWLYLTYWLEILHNIKILMFLASFMVIYLI